MPWKPGTSVSRQSRLESSRAFALVLMSAMAMLHSLAKVEAVAASTSLWIAATD